MPTTRLLRFFDRTPVRLVAQGARSLAGRPVFELAVGLSPVAHLRLGADRAGLLLAAGRHEEAARRLSDESGQKLFEVTLPALSRLARVDIRPQPGKTRADVGGLDYRTLDFAHEARRLGAVLALLAEAGGIALDPPLFSALDRADLLSDPATAARLPSLVTLDAPDRRPADLSLLLPSSANRAAPLAPADLAQWLPQGLRLLSPAASSAARLAMAVPLEGDPLEPAERAEQISVFLRYEEAMSRIDGWADPLRDAPTLVQRAYGWHRQQCFVHAASALLCIADGSLHAPWLMAVARTQLVALAGPGLADAAPPDSGAAWWGAIGYTVPVIEAAVAAARKTTVEQWRQLGTAKLLARAAVLSERACLTPQQFIDTQAYLAQGRSFYESLSLDSEPESQERLGHVDQLSTTLAAALARLPKAAGDGGGEAGTRAAGRLSRAEQGRPVRSTARRAVTSAAPTGDDLGFGDGLLSQGDG